MTAVLAKLTRPLGTQNPTNAKPNISVQIAHSMFSALGRGFSEPTRSRRKILNRQEVQTGLILNWSYRAPLQPGLSAPAAPGTGEPRFWAGLLAAGFLPGEAKALSPPEHQGLLPHTRPSGPAPGTHSHILLPI